MLPYLCLKYAGGSSLYASNVVSDVGGIPHIALLKGSAAHLPTTMGGYHVAQRQANHSAQPPHYALLPQGYPVVPPRPPTPLAYDDS